ncbi:MAG TPA: class I SAM-dependent methyltransferase [Patescibacteria group bacterium]|jgi:2-polyprenyl-3-methyl-5-hydroxy-6-metoxy-1,4-benzoquinol methylase|nr:class I SAM-dependent methyltransferase [Patescibacteria group bacterium]
MTSSTQSISQPKDGVPATTEALSSAYSAKSNRYFTGARRTFLDQLPNNPGARLLELGCGNGNTAAAALAEGRCGWACGIELCEGPAVQARTKLNQVIVGDIECLSLDLPLASFDILLMSEVLEHLRDPHSVLVKLRKLLKPGAIVLAGSPNVCHFSTILMLLRGRWNYEREGIMDETHVRWFSPSTYRELFEKAGYVVEHVRPASPLHTKARVANALLFRRFEYLFHSQIELRARAS